MSYASVLEAVRIAGLNNKAAGEVFSYLASNGGTATQLQAALQRMGACWAGGAERLSWDIANGAGYTEIRSALVACGAAHDSAADLLAYELSSLAPLPPGIPDSLYDAANIDGLNNSSLVDGAAIGTWVNLGALGSGLNLAQGTPANRPVYAATIPSKLNGQPAVTADGNRWITNGSAIASQAQPYIVASVFRIDDTAASYYMWTGFTEGNQHEMIGNFGGAGKIQLNNGGAFVDTTKTFVAGQWNMEIAVHNGANSFYRLNGVQSANFQTNAVAWTGVTLFGSHLGSFKAKGAFAIRAAWVGSAASPTVADIEAYFTARFGAFPQ